MKAIVTGATGFIGLALCRELLQRGYEVVAVVRPDSRKKAGLLQLQKDFPEESLQIIELHLKEMEALYTKHHIRADLFFHLAWDGPSGAAREDFDIQYGNIRYAAEALKAAKDCGCIKFIGAGSQAEYGVVDGIAYEGRTLPSPFLMYGAAKLAAYRMCALLAEQLKIRFLWPRIYSVYGAGENPGTLVNYVLSSLKSGEMPELSPCENWWNFLYISDCARALRMLGEKETAEGVCHVASWDTRKLKEFVVQMRDIAAPGAELGFGCRPADPKRTFQLQPEIGKLKESGLRPEISFQEGIRLKMKELRS